MQEDDLLYAGFWIRMGATVIDAILLMVIMVPLLASIYGWEYYSDSDKPLFMGPADFLISWVFPAIATITFWITKQATPGKMAFSSKVVDADTGNTPRPSQMIGRYFAYILSTLPLGLGFIWIAFDKRKQGWHDKLSGTVVVRRKRSGTEPVKFNQG